MTTSKPKENKNIEEKVPRLCVPTRYIVALMASMGIFVQFLLKFSVSVAIVAMVKTTSSGATNVTSMDACPNTATISTGTSAKEGEFDWSGTMQGFVLSSFYYGYICTQLLGGRLSEMFGAKLVMGPGILLAGILSLLAPIAARWHVAAFATIRILVGACVGVFFPALQNLFSKWFPPEEHQRTSGIMYSCMYLSNIISMSVSGVLSGISWDLVFYVYGGCAILWSIPWLFIIYNSPEEHPTISPEELLYITKSSDSEKGHGETLKPVPWKAILTSPPVWAAISVQSGGAYVTYTFMSELPTYSKNVLHFDVQGSGLISSLPYIFAWISCVSCGFISQWLQKKEYLTRIMAYRIFNGICSSSRLRCLQKRYIIAIMVSLGIIIQFLIKASMSVAIVAMVRPTSLTISDNNSTNERTTDTCPITETLSNSSSTQVGEFEWSSTLQGFILSAFYYGYITTQIIGGRLGEKYGAKFIMGPGLMAAGIMSLLTPIAARYHVAAFAVVRILTGVFAGVFFPSLQTLLAEWFPKEEYQLSSSILFSFIHVSNILSMSLSGVLANISWDLVFYIYGALAVVWVIPWLILVHSSPTQHPTITEEEKLYIMKDRMSFDGEIIILKPVPWFSILTSLPIWASTSFQAGISFVLHTFLSELPTYSKNILHFNIEKSGLISSIPYMSAWISCIICGFVSQWLQKKGYLTIITAYRVFNGICALGSGLCLLLITLVGCNSTAIVALLVITMFFQGSYCGGSNVNVLNLGPNYAGSITGISLTISNTMGILSAQIDGILIEGNQTLGQWKKVFYTTIAATIIPYIFYLIYGSAEEQEWNKQEVENIEEISQIPKRNMERRKKLSVVASV